MIPRRCAIEELSATFSRLSYVEILRALKVVLRLIGVAEVVATVVLLALMLYERRKRT